MRIASPNHGERATGVDMLVLHYTGMPDAPGAVARLTDPRSEVSSHYLVGGEGTIFDLVAESRRAWHAGLSSWHGETDLNSRSIGIEIDHPGHEGGNPDFGEAQIEAVILLCRDILARWPIPPARVLGHSGIAPRRKQDPGERFPWARLHRAGIGHYVEPAPISLGPSLGLGPGLGLGLGDDGAKVEELQSLLAQYGYPIEVTGSFGEQTRSVVTAFQRHFRQDRVDGCADASTLATLRQLVEALPKRANGE